MFEMWNSPFLFKIENNILFWKSVNKLFMLLSYTVLLLSFSSLFLWTIGGGNHFALCNKNFGIYAVDIMVLMPLLFILQVGFWLSKYECFYVLERNRK